MIWFSVRIWQTSPKGVDYADTVEYRDYDVQRVRWGGIAIWMQKPLPARP